MSLTVIQVSLTVIQVSLTVIQVSTGGNIGHGQYISTLEYIIIYLMNNYYFHVCVSGYYFNSTTIRSILYPRTYGIVCNGVLWALINAKKFI